MPGPDWDQIVEDADRSPRATLAEAGTLVDDMTAVLVVYEYTRPDGRPGWDYLLSGRSALPAIGLAQACIAHVLEQVTTPDPEGE